MCYIKYLNPSVPTLSHHSISPSFQAQIPTEERKPIPGVLILASTTALRWRWRETQTVGRTRVSTRAYLPFDHALAPALTFDVNWFSWENVAGDLFVFVSSLLGKLTLGIGGVKVISARFVVPAIERDGAFVGSRMHIPCDIFIAIALLEC